MTKQDVIELILFTFKIKNGTPQHIMYKSWLDMNLADKLSTEEKKLIQSAIDKLVDDDIITLEDKKGECLVLTQDGFTNVYPKVHQLIIEQSSDTAEKLTELECKITDIQCYNLKIEGKVEVRTFTDEAQVIFNEYYDDETDIIYLNLFLQLEELYEIKKK